MPRSALVKLIPNVPQQIMLASDGLPDRSGENVRFPLVNRFLHLGGACWNTRKERDANLARIPAAPADSEFVLDRLAERKAMERELREAIEQMIDHHQKAREQEQRLMDSLSPDSSGHAGARAVRVYHEGVIAGLKSALRLFDHFRGTSQE